MPVHLMARDVRRTVKRKPRDALPGVQLSETEGSACDAAVNVDTTATRASVVAA